MLTLAAFAATSCVDAQTVRHASNVFSEGTLSGVIRDTDGVPQMGALVQALLPGARLVKAFNTLAAKLLAADPVVDNGHRVLFVSGDDEAAKAEVSELIKTLGFAPIDLGSLAVGSTYQQAKGRFSTLNLIQL